MQRVAGADWTAVERARSSRATRLGSEDFTPTTCLCKPLNAPGLARRPSCTRVPGLRSWQPGHPLRSDGRTLADRFARRCRGGRATCLIGDAMNDLGGPRHGVRRLVAQLGPAAVARLFGYDVFISHTRDGLEYAAAL